MSQDMRRARPSESFVVELWRIAAQPTALTETVARLALVMAARVPLGLLLVRHLDLGRARLDTVAASAVSDAVVPQRVHDPLSRQAVERLLTAFRPSVVSELSEVEPDDPLAAAVPRGVSGQVLGAVLADDDEPCGVLLVVAAHGRRLDDRQWQVVAALVEPCAAALRTHCAMHRVVTEREAAEAARHSLLARLGHGPPGDVVVGAESGLAEVMERVEQVAHSDLPVLILGETGSGKEVVARTIHERSRRARAPFLRVNCGAIPAELVDSELFGHERGSFTGATHLRRGWFERADGGTLLLDEVAELSAAAQVRLLRVLQDGTFERVGGQRQLLADVRVVAATHRDLAGMVAAGRFREDLWYRLAVFAVHLPALRERREDLPALARHFALRASRRFGLTPQLPTRADLDLLSAYHWPGNVRELQAVVDRAAILGNGASLDIAAALGSGLPPAPRSEAPSTPVETPVHESILTLDDATRRHLERALAATAGRVEGPHGAARLLDVNPQTLRSRMRRLGVDWRRFHPRG